MARSAGGRKEAPPIATVRLIKHHISKGQSSTISLKGRLDYGRDNGKTNDGELISAYECDHETAEAEFLLAKAQYKAITGREQKRSADVLCYQIRQSFKPDEVTPEQANKIGYDLAMRWTKGKHAFFVATHIDSRCVHNHVYYNSTTLDCTHKFRDFIGSARVLRQLSDRICLENNLSIIQNPKLHSQGKYKHYGEWLKDNQPLSGKEQLKTVINACLVERPPDFDTFLAAMAAAGYEHKWGRGGVLSFCAEGQKSFTRLRASTLGEGYGVDEIRAIIEGLVALPESWAQAPPQKVNLIVDIQQKIREGKGSAYEKWAKVYNLKQVAAALQYLQENKLLEYADLEAKTIAATDRFHALAKQIRQVEDNINRNAELKAAIMAYAKTRPVFEEYKAKKYSRKYLAEHEADISTYRAARAAMQKILQGEKLPGMDILKSEYQRLAAEKRSGYREYRTAQKDMREAIAVKHNIDYLLGITGVQKSKEIER